LRLRKEARTRLRAESVFAMRRVIIAIVVVPAYAKLNLTLDLLGPRQDGYHEIASVMQTISLHDLLLVERSDCRVFESVGLPVSGENLVLRAARELEGALGQALSFRIRLLKRIPVGAGLGGGSADAAAFLRIAPSLYGLRLEREQLSAIAAAIGQDVPFLIQGGAAVASGRGSKVRPLPSLDPGLKLLVVCPEVEVSTAAVYQEAGESVGSARRTAAVAEALRAGVAPRAEDLGNDLEGFSRRRYPALAAAIDPLRSRLEGLRMTGTGAAFFTLVDGEMEAGAALQACAAPGLRAWLCRPVPAWT
jgi:4-diphosphocytidyl-2-C-methyl-D-erythritol kinase